MSSKDYLILKFHWNYCFTLKPTFEWRQRLAFLLLETKDSIHTVNYSSWIHHWLPVNALEKLVSPMYVKILIRISINSARFFGTSMIINVICNQTGKFIEILANSLYILLCISNGQTQNSRYINKWFFPEYTKRNNTLLKGLEQYIILKSHDFN